MMQVYNEFLQLIKPWKLKSKATINAIYELYAQVGNDLFKESFNDNFGNKTKTIKEVKELITKKQAMILACNGLEIVCKKIFALHETDTFSVTITFIHTTLNQERSKYTALKKFADRYFQSSFLRKVILIRNKYTHNSGILGKEDVLSDYNYLNDINTLKKIVLIFSQYSTLKPKEPLPNEEVVNMVLEQEETNNKPATNTDLKKEIDYNNLASISKQQEKLFKTFLNISSPYEAVFKNFKTDITSLKPNLLQEKKTFKLGEFSLCLFKHYFILKYKTTPEIALAFANYFHKAVQTKTKITAARAELMNKIFGLMSLLHLTLTQFYKAGADYLIEQAYSVTDINKLENFLLVSKKYIHEKFLYCLYTRKNTPLATQSNSSLNAIFNKEYEKTANDKKDLLTFFKEFKAKEPAFINEATTQVSKDTIRKNNESFYNNIINNTQQYATVWVGFKIVANKILNTLIDVVSKVYTNYDEFYITFFAYFIAFRHGFTPETGLKIITYILNITKGDAKGTKRIQYFSKLITQPLNYFKISPKELFNNFILPLIDNNVSYNTFNSWCVSNKDAETSSYLLLCNILNNTKTPFSKDEINKLLKDFVAKRDWTKNEFINYINNTTKQRLAMIKKEREEQEASKIQAQNPQEASKPAKPQTQAQQEENKQNHLTLNLPILKR